MEPATVGLWPRLREWAIKNPASALGLLALVVYAELRIPAELFYSHFGATATDAGFGNIEVVLEQSVQLLADYALLGIGWAALTVALVYPTLVTLIVLALQGENKGWGKALIAFAVSALALVAFGMAFVGYAPIPWALVGAGLLVLGFFVPNVMFGTTAMPERRAARQAARSLAAGFAVAGLVLSVAALLVFSLIAAGPRAANVKDGDISSSPLFPWHPRHVSVVWRAGRPPLSLPGCRKLTYLGEDGDRVLLYDERDQRTLRLTSSDIELNFPGDC
jgi:hypothetical protein